MLTRLDFSWAMAPQTPEFLFLSPLGSHIHLCFPVAFYQSLQRPWKPFNKWKEAESLTSVFLKLNVGAVSVSRYRATCSERARERGWHLFLLHSFTLTHSLCQFPLLSQSSSLSLTKPSCDDSVTAPQKRPVWSRNVGFLSRGAERGVFVWNESMCVFLCVCEFVNVWCMLRVTGGGPREGKRKKYRNGLTDGLIAKADLNQGRNKKQL